MKFAAVALFALLWLSISSAYALGGSTCATATVVDVLPYSDGGQLDPPGSGCFGEPGNDLFYVFTAPQTDTFRFDMCGSNSCCFQQMRLWTGGTCCSGASVFVTNGCVDGYPLYDFAMTAGQVVYIEIGKAEPDWAVPPLYVFNVRLANFDVCPGTPIPALPYSDSGSTASATHQYNGICYTQSAPDVVYNFTSPDSMLVHASMVATWFDCMHVRKNNCATGASLQCDFGNGADSSWFDFWVEPDSTYYFIVDGAFNTDYGAYTFTLRQLAPNDSCPGTVIPALPYADSGNTAIATHQFTGSCYNQSAPDVVYHFTSPDSAFVLASMVASWSESMQVRRSNCETGASLRCDVGSFADSAWFVFWVEPDSTYYFIMDGVNNTSLGPYSFTLHEVSPVLNDSCPGTAILALPYTDSGSTPFATHQYGSSCNSGQGRDVVYYFTSPNAVLATATVLAPWSDALYIRKNNCATGASLQCTYGFGPQSSQLQFWAEPDSTYYFFVDGFLSSHFGPYTFTLEGIPPVSNDLCPGTAISTLPYAVSGTTQLALHQYSGSCYTQSAPDEVYSFAASDSVLLKATVLAPWWDALQVRRNDCESSVSLHCDVGIDADSSWFVFWGEPDSTYYFIVDGEGSGSFGNYTFTLQELTPVPNDFCPGTVIPTLPYTDSGSTVFATHQYNDSYCTFGYSTPDVVYSFSSLDSVFVKATVQASWNDVLQVRRNNCATGAALLCDIGSDSNSSWFVFWVEPDSTYYFIVDGAFNGDFGNYVFTLRSLTCPAPDSLVVQKSEADAVLTWPPVECSSPLYSIYRSAAADVQPIPGNLIGTTTDTTYTDTGIQSDPGLKFFYAVTAATP